MDVQGVNLTSAWPELRPLAPLVTMDPEAQVCWGQESLSLSSHAAKPPEPMPESKKGVKDRLVGFGAKLLVKMGKSDTLAKAGYKIYGWTSKVDRDTKLDNVGQLSPTLMRGAQYGKAGLEQLKQQGVTTLINLRPESLQYKAEAEKMGFRFIHMPLPPLGKPSVEQGLQFLKTATDPKNGKVFFHCYHGADRTGAMAAAFRIAHDGWTADQAIAEMYQYRFHANGQQPKLDFVREFAAFWQQLPQAHKDFYLNRLPAAQAG